MIGDARRITGKWIKSSRCGPDAKNSNCVELNRAITGAVAVRDSKGPGTVLRFADVPWQAFLTRCRAEY